MIATMKALGCNWMTAARKATEDEARAFARAFNDVRLVVLGSDGLFWVVSARDAGKLRKAGFEVI